MNFAEFLMVLLASYGLCFAFMHEKIPFLPAALKKIPLFVDEDGENWFARMFQCPYCTGFHTGWLVWLLWHASSLLKNSPSVDALQFCVEGILFAFASSVVCYILDVSAERLEGV